MSDFLSNLRSQFRSATLQRNKGLALSIVRQLISLDPADDDFRRNFEDLVASVKSETDGVRQRLGPTAKPTELRATLDDRVPYWKSFTEDIPSLKNLLAPEPSLDGIEIKLSEMLKHGRIDDALKAYFKAGSPMNLQGSLALVLRQLGEIQHAEENEDLPAWRRAIEEFDTFHSESSTDELSPVKTWTSASLWRLRVSGMVMQIISLNAQKAKGDGPILASQIAILQEELRARPSLAGGYNIEQKLEESSAILADKLKSPKQHAWIMPLVFVGTVIAVAIVIFIDSSKEKGNQGFGNPSGPGTVWRPSPSKEAYDPKPALNDVSIPMPNGWKMIFRKIYLPNSAGKPGNYAFEIEGAKGAVWAPFKDEGGRYYLLAKYETSRGQYAQFMELAPPGKIALPVTEVTISEVEKYCELFSTELGRRPDFELKSVSGRPARVRLPTLAEWQFAARGGNVTAGTPLFDGKWPWKGPVTPREWHSGPASSSGELRQIGVLEAHPLGMFDVLGNARELAADSGQYSMVGCDYGTPDSEFSVFNTEAVPRLMPDANRPFRQPEVGFRLVLTADADTFQQ
jgi:Sulfatase-modifying factor enzyme 1